MFSSTRSVRIASIEWISSWKSTCSFHVFDEFTGRMSSGRLSILFFQMG
jgi:hypothetical protein